MKRIATLLLLTLATFTFAQEKTKVWVHAPAEDLLALFPDKGAGFLISLDEYNRLLELARKNRATTEAKSPLDARLVRGTVQGRMDGDRLLLDAEYVVVVQDERGADLPFRVGGIAITSIDVDEGGEYVGGVLRFSKAGEFRVRVKLARRVEKSSTGLQKAGFLLPSAAAHAVTLAVPARTEGEVGPIVRAFASGANGGTVTGYPDRTGLFRVWMRPRTRARRLDPIVSSKFAVMASVGETRTLASTRLELEILRAPLGKTTIELAPGQLVHALQGKGVKTWRLVRGAPRDKLEVEFVEPIEKKVVLTLETELPRDNPAIADLPFPRVPGAVRFRGTVGVIARPEVRLTGLRSEGARRLDQIPKSGIAMYEIYAPNGSVTADVEAIASKTRAEAYHYLHLGESGQSLLTRTAYYISGKPLFRLEPKVPSGWILRGQVVVNGRPHPHRLEPDGRLILEFANGLNPGVHVLQLRLDTDQVDWVPEDGAALFALADIRSGLDEESGKLAVSADPAFRIGVAKTTGLRSIGLNKLGTAVSDETLFAWEFDSAGFSAQFDAERHEPLLTATVIHRAHPTETILKMHTTVALKIERAGIRELKVALPKGTGKTVDFKGALIKERTPPEEGAESEVWTLRFQRRMLGLYRLDIVFDKTFEKDSWETVVPALAIPGASESGFVVIDSSDTSALTVDRGGLREADVAEMPEAPQQSPLEVLAYASHPFEVKVSSTRHDPHAVVQAIALSAHIYGVLSNDGRLRCRAEYRVRNNDQPFLLCGLPKKSRLLGALVNGDPIKPLLAGGWLKLPLERSKGRETPFLVALIYETAIQELDAKAKVTIARPVLDIDVLKTTYTLHLPDGYDLADHDGDMVPMDEKQRKTVLDDLGQLISNTLDRTAVGMAAGSPDDGYFTTESAVPGGARSSPPSSGPTSPRTAAFAREDPAQTKDSRSAADEIAPSPKPAQKPRSPANSPAKRELKKALAEKRPSRSKFKESKQRDKGVESTTREALEPEEEAELVEHNEVDTDREFEDSDGDGSRDVAGLETAAGRKGGRGRWQEARGGRQGTPPPVRGDRDEGKDRPRLERALLSLDVQFLKSDNVVRLESLAPTGTVNLQVARHEVFTVRLYLGAIIGLALAIVFLLAPRISILRILPATALLLFGVHFAGLSFLSGDFARGLGWALMATLGIALVIRIPRLIGWVFGLLRRIRFPRRPAKGAGAAVILLAAGFAHAQDSEEILVPYKGDAYEKIDSVFLSSERYHALRKLAFPDQSELRTVVSNGRYHTTREGDDVTVTAHYTIRKSTDAAERIALRLQKVAVTAATLNGKPATLAVDAKRGYSLLVAAKGDYQLTLTMRPRLQVSKGTQWVALPVRPVATATLVLKDNSKGFKVEVGALGGEQGGTHRVGPVTTLSVVWRPETKGFTAQTAELRAQTDLACSVRDGFTAVGASIRFGISGGSTTRVRVKVDKNFTVRQVWTKFMAGWEQDDDGVVTVVLSKPHTREALIGLVAERATERLRTESIPIVQALDVVRDAGTITLETLPDLKLEVLNTQGLMRGTTSGKAPAWRGTPEWGTVHSVQRYAVRPFTLDWRVSVEQTSFRAKSDTWLTLHKEQIAADVRLDVEVERGPGLFALRVGVPADYEVLTASGPHVRDWWLADGVLHIALRSRHTARAQYAIQLRRRGPTTEVSAAPALTLLGAVRQSGMVRVLVADGLDIETGESEGLLPVNLNRIAKVNSPGFRMVRAYQHVAVPWSLTVSTREERREVEALTVTRVVPLADRVRVEALVNFHVRRGLVDEVAFDVPVTDEKGIVIVAPEQRESKSVLVDGGRRYFLSLRNPTRGSVAVTVTYHVPYGTAVRGVEPEDVSQLRRYVAVEKISDGAVKIADHPSLESVEYGDFPIIPPGSSAESVAATFVGTGDPFSLTVDVKAHSFEEVARALIYSAAAQVVVDRSGWTRTMVSYRVYNRSRQFLVVRLPKDARLYSVMVDGKGVRPLSEGGKVMVPLRKVAIGATTFDVDVVYAYGARPLNKRDLEARLPTVEGIDVRRHTVSLYLPKGMRYSFDTDMEEVDASSITVGQAADLYDEIKELYGVAERGNALQAQRALTNVVALEREVKRVTEQVEQQSDDRVQIKQIESQNRALDALRRSRGQLKQRFVGVVQGQAAANLDNNTQQIFGLLAEQRGQTVESWKVNDEYLARNKFEDNEDLQEFRKANFRRGDAGIGIGGGAGGGGGGRGGQYRGPNGGVPPGQRDPSDPKAPPPPPGDAAASRAMGLYLGDKPTLGKLAQPGGADASFGYDAKAKNEDRAPRTGGAFFNDGLDGEWRARTENTFYVASRGDAGAGAGAKADVPLAQLDDVTNGLTDFTPPAIEPLMLTNATGRVSLRIDLPKDGDVFHFATASSTAVITVEASEPSGGFWKGLLAFVFLAIGVFVLRIGRS